MAARGALRRLMRLLEGEEEQAHRALQAALGGVQHLRRAREQALERERGGRQWMAAHAGSPEAADRIAGLEETRIARRLAIALAKRIQTAEEEAFARREVFLAKRTERLQAEALLRQAEEREARVTARRAQQTMDDWRLARRGGAAAAVTDGGESEDGVAGSTAEKR